MTLTKPGFPLFASDEGDWGTAFSLPRMHELTLGLPDRPRHAGDDLSQALTKTLEGDEVIVYLKPEDKWPSELQFMSLRVLEHLDAELADNVLQALYAWYPTLSKSYDFLLDNKDMAHLLPRLEASEGLHPLIRLDYIAVQPLPSLTPYLGLGFSCSWDEEHGLGLMTYGTEVLEIGGEDTALSVEVAREHQAKVIEQLGSQQP